MRYPPDPIITSMLDDDMYKLTMQQAIFHQYPLDTSTFQFTCRNKGVDLARILKNLVKEVKALGDVRLTDNEANYLSTLSFFKDDYIDFLLNFRYEPDDVIRGIHTEGPDLYMRYGGDTLERMMWEVKLLCITNELYFREIWDDREGAASQNDDGYYLESDFAEKEGDLRLTKKIKLLNANPQLKFADFGTRRRYSKVWHEHVLRRLIAEAPDNLIGTSNVDLARRTGIRPVGTMAHEWIMGHLGRVSNVRQAQKRALYVWLQEYGDQLGIALTDTFTSDAFFRDFDITLANAYSGLRHDSGDPFVFGDKVIAHYEKLGIDPMTKTVVFSDGLDFETALSISNYFQGRIKVDLKVFTDSYGIGTNVTNDVGFDPLNIVIKMVECNNIQTIKLSDVPGKVMGSESQVANVKQKYNIL